MLKKLAILLVSTVMAFVLLLANGVQVVGGKIGFFNIPEARASSGDGDSDGDGDGDGDGSRDKSDDSISA